jgi:2-oxoglutarate ferredoxin oxidoreductase subunit gamma
MNLPSLDKFEPMVRKNGLLLINSSLIDRTSNRDDIRIVLVPANEIAMELKNPRGGNMVALGAYVGCSHAVPIDAMERVVRETFSSKPQVIDVNITALHRGFELGEKAVA